MFIFLFTFFVMNTGFLGAFDTRTWFGSMISFPSSSPVNRLTRNGNAVSFDEDLRLARIKSLEPTYSSTVESNSWRYGVSLQIARYRCT